jgi:DNA-binding NarL/FixJ family response regulator
VRILLVEDHPTTRFGVRAVVELEDWTEVVGEAEGAREARRMVEELNPDLVILDLRLKGDAGGIELCRDIKSRPEPSYVLIYTAYNAPEEITACQLSGADSYVHKSEDPEVLLDALQSARKGERRWFTGAEYEDPDARLDEAAEQAGLTPRECEIFEMLRRGRTNPQIATELHIGTETAKTHVKNVLDKLGYGSRYEIP